ncbi:hypothetical protein LR48_Vigan01g236100 [Vigna angularis]|uniref:Uncharacterized protein n=2 Tax=Phaseolus angularis TaxID=3914 RepID=A0A0L9TQG8_PHAAN|nr:hypothetical protein LR48_Vigan01g236100 [Vigna angularis]BAT76093.1 hypothetical protein VIGAN_01405200 [Vigna angularis var. angularis]
MAVEVVGLEMVKGPVENGAEGGKPVLHEKENGKLEKDVEPVKVIKGMMFLSWRPYEDPTIKSKIDLLDKEIIKKNQAHFQITKALKAKRFNDFLNTIFFSSPTVALIVAVFLDNILSTRIMSKTGECHCAYWNLIYVLLRTVSRRSD